MHASRGGDVLRKRLRAHAHAWRSSMTDLLHRDTSTSSLHAPPIPDKTRRRLLMFGAGAAIATPVLAAPAAIVGSVDIGAELNGSKSHGYQETEHVRRYYATTRL